MRDQESRLFVAKPVLIIAKAEKVKVIGLFSSKPSVCTNSFMQDVKINLSICHCRQKKL